MSATNIALGVVIGGAVGATFGKALSDSSQKIDAFAQRAMKARGFQGLIGDTIRLRQEMAKTADKSSDAFGKLLKTHDSNIAALKKQGFAVNALDKDYAKLGRTAKGLELGATGRAKIGEGMAKGREALGMGAAISASVAAPTMVSANYQAIIRDIAIKGGFARTGQETQMSEQIRTSASDQGIGRNDLADAINQLVAGGMDAKEALQYRDVIGKFAVGQGAAPEETAKMIRALSQNAKITDAKGMNQALESIAFLGKAGNFESPDMAKAFPGLLAEMEKLGITGQDAVTQLGAMLQVQMKVTGSADEAANNLKNWFSKIGSGETKKSYEKAGIDYEQSMKTNITQGLSTLESSMGIAQQYIEKIDPKKADELKKFAQSLSQVGDPAKQKAQIAAFEETMKTGDLFNDMQVKAALTAYMQNGALYQKLKTDSAKATGELAKDLDDRRDASKQKWGEVANAMDEALARIGDAIRPATDLLANSLKGVGNAIAWTAEKAPVLAGAVLGLGVAVAAVTAGKSALKIGGGVLDVARGAAMARGAGKLPGLSTVPGMSPAAGAAGKKPGIVGKVADLLGAATGVTTGAAQQVFVTNWPGAGLELPGLPDAPGKPGSAGKVPAKTGMGARLGTVLTGARMAGQAALAAPTLGAVAAGGTGTLAAAGGMVAGAGVVGYGIGTVINAGISKALTAGTGKETTLGGWVYDKLNPEKAAAVSALTAPAPPKPAAMSAPMPIPASFSPSIAVTVQGDVKDPRLLAAELMPHLRRQFEQFQAQSTRGAMFDPARS